MITDPIFYRLFETSPETFFLVLGMSPDSASKMAARYQYEAIEFKETSHRADGVFLPKEPELPLYFLEVQFYLLPSIFADLLVKVYTYLKNHDPGQLFCGVVLFASRSLEPEALAPYQPLIQAGMIRRFYLDEMPEIADAPMGLSILYLLRTTEAEAPMFARDLVARARTEIHNEALQADLIEFIETIILYKVPRLNREEIKAMLQLHDIRESRAYQEAQEEGMKEGIKEGIAIAIEKMGARKMAAKEIAEILEVDLVLVQRVLARQK